MKAWSILLFIVITIFYSLVGVSAQSSALDNVDSYLKRYVKKTPVPGFSIVIVEGEKVIFSKGYGVERQGGTSPMTSQSKLAIDALGRGFTSMAVLQLVEQGLLDLDEPIVTYIPWFKTANKDFSDLITLRMCLSNTSGIPPQYESMPSINNEDALEEFIRSFDQHIIKRRPGMSHEFCDEGYSIAGYIISQVSGMPYHKYIEKNILAPLEMTHSNASLTETQNALLGHEMDLDRCIPATATESDPNYSAAGSQFYSTTSDLSHYMIALLNNGKYKDVQILKPQSIKELFRSNTSFEGLGTMLGGNGIDIQYALGWMGMTIEDREILIHTGGNGRSGSIMGINKSKNQAFAMLFNADVNLMDRFEYPGMENTVNNVIHLLNREDTTDFGVVRSNLVTEESYDLPRDKWTKYIGTYESFGKQNPLFRDRVLRVENINNQYLQLTVFQQSTFKGRYRLDFVNESRATLRNISQPREIQFSIYPDGFIGGLFMFGSEFKKRRSKDVDQYVLVGSPLSLGKYELPKDITTIIDGNQLKGKSPSGQEITIDLHQLGKMNFADLVSLHIDKTHIRSKGILNKTRIKKGIWTEQTFFTDATSGIVQHIVALYQDPSTEKEMHLIISQPWGKFNADTAALIQGLQRSISF